MDTIDRDLERDLEVDTTVPPDSAWQPQPESAPRAPTDELHSHIEYHHGALKRFLDRAQAARTSGRAAIAEWEDERRRLRQEFDERMRQADAEIAAIKASTAAEVAKVERLAGATRKLLEELQS